MRRFPGLLLVLMATAGRVWAAQLPASPAPPSFPPDPLAPVFATGTDQKEAQRIVEGVWAAFGFANAYLVTTPAGNVVIDTGNGTPTGAARQNALLRARDAGPVKAIILTHGHADHIGGVPVWREAGTEVIAQRRQVELLHYQNRLAEFFRRRNAAQFGIPIPPSALPSGNRTAVVPATRLVDEQDAFELGGLRFELLHTPGETEDHLTVWIPKLKVAFVGDNYYTSFPNIYTLRGTAARPALDYVDSLDRVLALQPEVVLPGHGPPLVGAEEIRRRLRQYRDAILYVHDQTVKGMNEGKDVFTLMREVRLPPELALPESYGKVSWSVRGIYEGYVGWFDADPVRMYDLAPRAVEAELAGLVGPEKLSQRAREVLTGGDAVRALALSEAALASAPGHVASLRVRLDALKQLREACRNSNERGWLDDGIRQTEAALARGAR